MELFESFLNAIAPYVIVVGSFGRNEETEDSDIDCFLRSKPLKEIDPETGDDTYIRKSSLSWTALAWHGPVSSLATLQWNGSRVSREWSR